MVRSPLQAGQSWSRRAVRSSGRPVAASRKIDVLVQVVAKASASDRQEVGVAPLWRRMSPILHNRRKCAKSNKWAIYSTQSQRSLSKLPFPPFVEIPAASNMHRDREKIQDVNANPSAQ